MSKRHMRLPNGFGQITKISNRKLRKPYRAMVTIGKTELGKPICRILKPDGYFETYNKAYEALMNYHKDPYKFDSNITMNELYDKWYSSNGIKLSPNTLKIYQSAWTKHCKSIHSIPVKNIKPAHLIDTLECISSENVKALAKFLLNSLFDYACAYDLTDRNIPRLLKIKSDCNVKEPHKSFTDDEMNKIYENINQPIAKWLLVQSYTGLRPNELCCLRASDIQSDRIFTAGSKTQAGKNRYIPIHPNIKDVLTDLIKESQGRDLLLPIKYGEYNRLVGEFLPGHKAHDPRKHFVTMAKKYQLEDTAIKRIVGHEIKDITERVYTDRSFEWLKSEIMKIPCMNNV